MELYGWVHTLQRFAHNAREALNPAITILDTAEMLLTRVGIFAGFVYGLYALTHGR